MSNDDFFNFDSEDEEFDWGNDSNMVQPQSQQPRSSRPNTLPNPNDVMPTAEQVKRDYNKTQGNGARQVQGVPVGNAPQGNRGNGRQQQRPQQGQQRQGQRPQGNGQRPQGQRPQGNGQQQRRPQGNGQRPQGNGQRPQGNGQQQQRPQQRQQSQQQPPQKKKSIVPKIIIGLLILGIVAVVGKKVLNNRQPDETPVVEDYDTSGKKAYDTLLSALNAFNAEALDASVGTVDGDSYLAKEWAYSNNVKLHDEFLQKVGSMVQFSYPEGSMMNGGEKVTVTLPDYAKIADTMNSDGDYIRKMVSTAGYAETDYTWHNEVTLLMLQYFLDMDSIPTTTKELSLPVGLSNGVPKITDDAELDDMLFASDDFHKMCTAFDQMVTNYTGFKDETYYEDEEQHNPEYDEWLKLFNQYYEEDNGEFNKHTSKWEPWYLRDDNNEYILDENGEKIVNYYSVKDENGKDWIEPDKTIMVKVEKHRDVPDPWVEEKTIYYSCMGTHYIETYNGEGDTTYRVGDGSKTHPAGIGTTIITKVRCTDGEYHDVRVALVGYWTGQDAIDYAELFSTKNRGFTTVSVVKLICYEVQIENLENQAFTFETTEMSLADDNSNISSRTGTMYGFSQNITLQAGETQIVNDWASSTELEQKYAIWGKDFGRTYPMVYFDCLAGTGVIPPYSAYKAFTGQSSIDETITVKPTDDASTTPDTNTQSIEVTTEGQSGAEENVESTEASTNSE